jgi:uncharacterized membrane protein
MPPTSNRQPEAPADDQRGDALSGDALKGDFQDLFSAARDLAFTALQDKALTSVRDTVHGVTERLTEYVEQSGGGPGLMAAVTGARKLSEGASPGRALLGAGATGLKEKVKGLFGGGKGGKGGQGKKLKLINIVESADVGVPVRVAYNQWTQFGDFPKFMKKVENVDSPSDEKLNWKAQIFWSHRTWESNIVRQIPDERIVWRSKGPKGHVDGAVTFHELGPNFTRILLILEYHPQGLFERTGNIWRAQGRRARLELKHFRRHVMTQVALHPDEVEGWRGVIEDGKVVKDHETALQEEEQAREEGQPEGEAEEGQPEGEAEEELPEGEAEEELPEGEAEEELPEGEAEEELPEGEAGEEEEEEPEAGEEEEEPEAGEEEEEEEEERVPVGRERRSQAQAGRSSQRSTGARGAPSRRPANARAGRGRA